MLLPTSGTLLIHLMHGTQASDKGSKGIRYTDGDDSVIDFKQVSRSGLLALHIHQQGKQEETLTIVFRFLQVVLRSRALEITTETCISSPLSPEQIGHLQQLLSCFLPHADAQGLALAVGRLGELLGEDTQSYDSVSAAQGAISSAISALKTSKDTNKGNKEASVLTKLAKIDANLDKHQGFLTKMQTSSVSK